MFCLALSVQQQASFSTQTAFGMCECGGQHVSYAKHCIMGFPGGSVVENPPVSAADAGDSGSILGSENPLEEEMATHSINLACQIPGTEEPGGLKPRGPQRVRHD